jgi:hypothetical protein
MNELHTVCQVVKRALPESAVLKLDLPVQSDRGGWLDIEYGGKWVVVEWRPGIGFGVSLAEGLEEDPAKGLFEGPDEVLANREKAQERILSLLHDSTIEVRPRRAARG